MIVTARPPKRGRQRKPSPAIPNRIVTYTPKRKRDAWTKYLRLTGNAEEPPAPWTADDRAVWETITGHPEPTATTLCGLAREVLSDKRMRSQGLR
jgi:hypothetical protein